MERMVGIGPPHVEVVAQLLPVCPARLLSLLSPGFLVRVGNRATNALHVFKLSDQFDRVLDSVSAGYFDALV
jgi:hypothetical protein